MIHGIECKAASPRVNKIGIYKKAVTLKTCDSFFCVVMTAYYA